MAVRRRPIEDDANISAKNVLQWAKRRPGLALLLAVCALAFLAVSGWLIRYMIVGGDSGPKVIHGSPWDARRVPDGPKKV
jgi:hypothetical protein